MSIDFARLKLVWTRLHQTLWWRPASVSLGLVGVVLLASLADDRVPLRWLPNIEGDLAGDLLRIMASSMLVVSTFSLSVLASAYASAGSAGTPRATRLVVADPRSQRAVAVFLAAFIFAIVGIIAMGVRTYGPAGRMALFLCTLGVLLWVIVAFLSYIDVLSRIGRVSHTIKTVEGAACDALVEAMRDPTGGAQPADGPPDGARPVHARCTGYVQFVDMDALQEAAEEASVTVHVDARPGTLVHPQRPLAWVSPSWAHSKVASDDAMQAAVPLAEGGIVDKIHEAFIVGDERTIEQDAGYGLIVLGEIAERALSPGVNDPGTAIAVFSSQTRLLIAALGTVAREDASRHTALSMLAPVPSRLVVLAFESIARNASKQYSVMEQLIRHLQALSENASAEVRQAIRELAQRVLQRAERQDADPDDLAQWWEQAGALGVRRPR